MALRNEHGQSLIEALVGIIFLVPVVLFLFDISILVLASTANDALAKQAARAAAGALSPGPNQPPDAPGSPGYWKNAQLAAQAAITRYEQNQSSYLQGVSLKYLAYNDHSTSAGTGGLHTQGVAPGDISADPGNGNCLVVIDMKVKPPVPLPGFDPTRVLTSMSTEPITSVPP